MSMIIPTQQIRAVYNDQTIRVYQAYSDAIANTAHINLVWSRESELGVAARFLIEHIRQQRQQPRK